MKIFKIRNEINHINGSTIMSGWDFSLKFPNRWYRETISTDEISIYYLIFIASRSILGRKRTFFARMYLFI